VNVNVGTLEMRDGGEIIAQTRGPMDGGNLNVTAREVQMSGVNAQFNTGLFGGQFSGAGTGRSANVIVQAESISLTGSSNPNLVTGVFGATSGPGPGGSVQVNAKTLQMGSNTGLQNTTFGPGAGGTVAVNVKEISITGSGNPNIFTGIFANSFGSGRGGLIQVTSDRIKLANHAAISAAGFRSGDAGSLAVAARTIEMSNGSQIYTNVLFGSGNAGNLSVSADSLMITGFRDSTNPFASGFDFTGLSTSTGALGQRGGDLSVTAGSIVLADKASIFSSSSGAGAAGNIQISADTLRVSSRSAISTNAFGSGPGGNIDIAARKVTLEGAGAPLGPNDSIVSAIASQASAGGGAAGHISIKAGQLEVLDGGKISTQTFGRGNGGNLEIAADSVLVSGINAELQAHLQKTHDTVDSARAAILASSERFLIGDAATGNAGKVRVEATDLRLNAGGSISSTTDTPGAGGRIELVADTVRLSGGALISAESSTSTRAGKAGDVSISARGTVEIVASSITSAADHAAGGSIVIQGGAIRLADGALVSAKSSGAGDAGSIAISANDSLRLTNSVVSTEAVAADGGNIRLAGQHTVQLTSSRVTTSVQTGTGGGGNISIDPQFVILKDSAITANAFGGPGGNITIVTDSYVADAGSVVEASSALSAPGSVTIQSPDNNLAGGIAQLPRALLDASRLMQPGCSARRSGMPSSFTAAGRGGVPVDADGYLPSTIGESTPALASSMLALDCRQFR
jgi:large exoprotein involved in heme utilization and adhesion